MKTRTKFKFSIAVWLFVGFILLVCSVELSGYFLLPLVLLTMITGGYHLSLRCRSCGKWLWHPGALWIPKK